MPSFGTCFLYLSPLGCPLPHRLTRRIVPHSYPHIHQRHVTFSPRVAAPLPLSRLNYTCTAQPTSPLPPLPHEPVLVEPILSHFSHRRMHTFIDCTVGAGGHARALLTRYPSIRRYIGIDKDAHALRIARDTLRAHAGVVTLLHGDFRDLRALAEEAGVRAGEADGVLLDVGVSSMQVDEAGRGFSFARDGPLDMRMGEGGTSAADVVNGASAEVLERVFREFGEERQARRVAAAVVAAREGEAGPVATTGRLAEVICGVKGWRKRGVHPATQCFQALRIAVNGELEALDEGLAAAVGLLRGGGRLAVVCFHSLEDRIAKRRLREWAEEGAVGIVTRKPVVAGVGDENVRSRSAKLRVGQRLEEGELPWGRKVNKYERERRERW